MLVLGRVCWPSLFITASCPLDSTLKETFQHCWKRSRKTALVFCACACVDLYSSSHANFGAASCSWTWPSSFVPSGPFNLTPHMQMSEKTQIIVLWCQAYKHVGRATGNYWTWWHDGLMVFWSKLSRYIFYHSQDSQETINQLIRFNKLYNQNGWDAQLSTRCLWQRHVNLVETFSTRSWRLLLRGSVSPLLSS